MADHPLEHGFPAQPATWKNFHRFSPLMAYFGEKVLARVAGKLGIQRIPGDNASLKLRLQLWRDEQVRELLRPANMKLSAWVDSVALDDFLKRSEREDFSFGDQWARLLSLECALRVATGMHQGSAA
jgi:hypothetical protein